MNSILGNSSLLIRRGHFATTLAMGLVNFTCFVNLNWSHRTTAVLVILIFLVSYPFLWFYWKGRNWARLLVLFVSAVAVLNLGFLIYPLGNGTLHVLSLIANASLGIFLLYWLNRKDVKEWFKSKKATAGSANN